MNSRLRFGIIFLMALLLAVVFVLIGISLGATFTGRTEFLSDSAPSWIASIATVVIALLTIVLALETHAMRSLQQKQIDKIRGDSIRPNLDLHLGFSPAAFNFADLVLRNSGLGMARDVRINFVHVEGRGLEEHAKGIISQLRKPSFAANGVSTLGPSRELSSFVISFLELADDASEPIMDVCIEAHIECLDEDRAVHKYVSIIDMAEFRGISELGGRPAYDTVKQLKRIGDAFESLTKKQQRIQVDAFSTEDRKTEREMLKRRLDEQKQRRKEAKEK